MKLKTVYKVLFWITISCLFIDTIGQFIPIYFIDTEYKLYFYPLVFILLVVTLPIWIYQFIYNPQKDNSGFATIIAFITEALVLLIFGFITLVRLFTGFNDAMILYTNRYNSDIKIVSRLDGGRDDMVLNEDFVVKRPILPFFKLETLIDTNSINKTEWIKQK